MEKRINTQIKAFNLKNELLERSDQWVRSDGFDSLKQSKFTFEITRITTTVILKNAGQN